MDIHGSGRQKSAESDSGGSSVESLGDVSPPDTPSLVMSGNGGGIGMSNIRKDPPNKHHMLASSRHNGGRDKHGGTSIMYVPSGVQSPQYSLAGSVEMLVNVNNSQVGSAPGSGNNNNSMVGGSVLMAHPPHISSPAPSTVVTTTNPLMLHQYAPQHMQQPPPTQQQQFITTTTAYTYPLPGNGNQRQHQPPPTFRHPAFQIQPNGEIIYPYPPTQQQQQQPPSQPPPPAGITFLTQPPANVRLSPSIQPAVVVPLQADPTIVAAVTPFPITASVASISSKQILSCFNCGSQSHTGRDCREASMEDVTRNSIYKLDYEQAAAQAAAAIETDASTQSTSLTSSTSSTSTAASYTSVIGAGTGK